MCSPLERASLLVQRLAVDISINGRRCGTDSPPLCPECKVEEEPRAVCCACQAGCHVLIWSAGGGSRWGKCHSTGVPSALGFSWTSGALFFKVEQITSPASREASFNGPLTVQPQTPRGALSRTVCSVCLVLSWVDEALGCWWWMDHSVAHGIDAHPRACSLSVLCA